MWVSRLCVEARNSMNSALNKHGGLSQAHFKVDSLNT